MKFAVFIVLAALVAFLESTHAASIEKRAVSQSTGDMSLLKECHSTTPCGWAVYFPLSRRIDYFMKNTCECPKGKVCLRTVDDIATGAYVYKCRPDPQPISSQNDSNHST